VLGLEVFKTRRCSTCTLKDQDKYGCENDISPFYFDGEKQTRCPLRPFKEEPQFYSDVFKLYAFREKGVLAEEGAFYDQPNYYVDLMTEMDSAISDSYTAKEDMKKEEDNRVRQLQAMGINFTQKK
jgi:hypothetical protein